MQVLKKGVTPALCPHWQRAGAPHDEAGATELFTYSCSQTEELKEYCNTPSGALGSQAHPPRSHHQPHMGLTGWIPHSLVLGLPMGSTWSLLIPVPGAAGQVLRLLTYMLSPTKG